MYIVGGDNGCANLGTCTSGNGLTDDTWYRPFPDDSSPTSVGKIVERISFLGAVLVGMVVGNSKEWFRHRS